MSRSPDAGSLDILMRFIEDYVDNGVEATKVALAAHKNLWTVATRPFVVYRYQNAEYPTLTRSPVISTTTKGGVDMLLSEFAKEGETCCFFEVHVQPGVRYLNLNKIYDRSAKLRLHKHELEVIIEGGCKATITGTKKIKGYECKVINYEPKSRSRSKSRSRGRKVKITLAKLLEEDEETVKLLKNDIISNITAKRRLPNIIYNPEMHTVNNSELNHIKSYLESLE